MTRAETTDLVTDANNETLTHGSGRAGAAVGRRWLLRVAAGAAMGIAVLVGLAACGGEGGDDDEEEDDD